MSFDEQRRWAIELARATWRQLGLDIDRDGPSVALYLPGFRIEFGRLPVEPDRRLGGLRRPALTHRKDTERKDTEPERSDQES
jgi:hypothetical protein